MLLPRRAGHGAAPSARSPIISSARCWAVSSRGSHSATTRPMPHDGRPVAERLDLLQLVADVEDRAALPCQPPQGGEQLRHLLRRQHRGRLVHDQQLRILQQAADDLDALALADRKIVHAAVGIERQAIGLARPRRSATSSAVAAAGSSTASAMFSATVRASNSEKCWNTMPMPSRRAKFGLGMRIGLALPADLAGIGMQHAIDDLDQRALARTVLAEQGMDLAGQDLEIDAVVGEAAREALDDTLEREKRNGRRRCFGHAQAALPPRAGSPPSAVMFPPVVIVALLPSR